MNVTTPAAIIAASVILAATTMTGCTAAGYLIGGALDGGPRRIADSVSVETYTDSAGGGHRFLDMDRLRSLSAKSGRGRDPVVTVNTQDGAFSGESFTVDTVLAVEGDSLHGWKEESLPGDTVFVTMGDSISPRLTGRVVSLSQNVIVLRIGNADRDIPLHRVTSLVLTDERELKGADLASAASGGRLIRVPGLALGPASSPRFIPLRTVERVTLTRSANRWGQARMVCMAIGAGFDIAIIVVLLEDALHLDHDADKFHRDSE